MRSSFEIGQDEDLTLPGAGTLSDNLYDVIVIGGGPAGLAAALEAKRANPAGKVLIIERDKQLGGILQQCIHNGFGLHFFGEELTGPEYAERFILKLDGSGIDIRLDTMVLEVTPGKQVVCVSERLGLEHLEARAIVLAMGCRERTRGALNIPGSRPSGVFTAGMAQRFTNIEGYLPGKRVVVLGSGDIGLIMARRMTWSGAKVEMVLELMPYSSGLNRNIVQCLVDNDIPLKFNHTVIKIHGRERLTGVTVAEVDPGTRQLVPGSEQYVECDTLLLSVGLIPENELSQAAGVGISSVTSGPLVDERRETDVPGIFACGNVLHVHDLVDNVSEEAEIAGRAAMEFALNRARRIGYNNVNAGRGIRYTVPQKVSEDVSGKLDLYFRVDNAYRGARLIVKCAGELLYDRKKQIMTPGEMEKVQLDASKITGDIEISLLVGG